MSAAGQTPADMTQTDDMSAGLPGGSLAAFLLDHPGLPDRPVLHWKGGSLNLSELTSAVRLLAGRLGPVSGMPVVCLVDDGVRAVTAMFATWVVGGVYIPINARLTDAEVHAHLAQTSPAVVLSGLAQAQRVPADLHQLVEQEPGVWIPGLPGPMTIEPSFVPQDALVIRTSGTTGESKPVILGHDGVRDGIDTVITSLRGKAKVPSDRPPMPNLIPSSLALWAGIWNTLFAFRLGAPAVLLDQFDPVDYADLVRRFGIRSSVLAPAMMTMLTEDPRVSDLAPLRIVRSVTAPLAPVQARRFRDRFGVDVLNSYGQTELGGEVVGWTAADIRTFGDEKLGAVGRAHPGVVIRILDERQQEVSPNVTGEIWIRSPFVMREAVDSGRIIDGFLRTGDLGRVDAERFLWIEGRVSDMINRGGLKIVPQEVEEALRRHPYVADACVAGVPDLRLGEVPVAWVRTAAGTRLDEGELRTFVRGSLAGYKVPVAVRFLDDFPRTEIGKVRRGDLVESYIGTQSPEETDIP
jgi:long-chain acyl-CoA synthetase